MTYFALNLKLNCHVETSCGKLPSSSASVRPTWMIFSRSTLHRMVW